MKIIRVKPPNHFYRWGLYKFYSRGNLRAVGFRFPFTKMDLRLRIA